MSTDNKLVFYNKEGYPFNFQYDSDNKMWGGKIFFDENSSDTFKTICMYIFEEVPAFDFDTEFHFLPSELFNRSGMTFVSAAYVGETITNIKKVNSNSNFYSKWIEGVDFDKKFPIGSLITFKDVTGIEVDDFASGITYNVIGSQKNAFLISTQTNNAIFNTGTTYLFSGGTVSGVNAIKVLDFNQNIDITGLTYYEGKKLSVVGSSYNDGIKTYKNYENLKTSIYDFNLSAETPSTLNVEFDLMTQRPELYEGNVIISGSTSNTGLTNGIIIEFVNGINTNIDFVGTGQTIVFETPDGGTPEYFFTITGYVDREFIKQDLLNFYSQDGINIIECMTSVTGLTINDIIELKSVDFISGHTFHDKRQFQVTNVEENKIQVREYVISEGGYLQVNTTTNIGSNIVKINEPLDEAYYNIGDMIMDNPNIPSGSTILSITGETFTSNPNSWRFIISETAIGNSSHYPTILRNYGSEYIISKVINKKKVKKVYCQGLSVGVYFTGYTVCYSTTNHIKLTQDYVTSGTTSTYFYENTISSMRNKYKTLLNRYAIDLYHYNYSGTNYLIFEGSDYNFSPHYSNLRAYLGNTALIFDNNFNTGSTNHYFKVDETLTNEKIYFYETSKLAKESKSEILFDLKNDSTDYGFKLKLNDTEYYIDLAGETLNSGITTYSQETILSFILKYEQIIGNKGFNLSMGYNVFYSGYTLIIEGQKPNVELYNLEVKVNFYSNYNILENDYNKSIVISSNELEITSQSSILNDYGISTGMIINVSGSTNTFNNKQYNIIKLTGDTTDFIKKIQLSYQGPFMYESDKVLNISVNNFLRKPRGTYGKSYTIENSDYQNGIETVIEKKDIYYRFSWYPIEENSPTISKDIFYYDYSGDQLTSNGELTYIGKKPLWTDSNSMVFLNDEPNKNIQNIKNPEAQQTVFDSLSFLLESLDSASDYDFTPEPLQVFIGFNSKMEGVQSNNMIMEKVEEIIFSGNTSPNNNIFIISGNTINYLLSGKTFDFNDYGFSPGQLISLNFKELTPTGETLFENYEIYEILDVSMNKIKINGSVKDFNTSGKTYEFKLNTEPIIIGSFYIYGQTEIEDSRFDNHLNLLGSHLDYKVQEIFKESDINDNGIDFILLNRKRKEMLGVYSDIYDYIGSYKALINSINFFGYNDLELYEYYRNVKLGSPLYGKLQKSLIEDIFVNTIPGWDEIEWDNKNHIKTNLFNLTYQITDFEGNYLNLYSLEEVQIKLTGLVHWLRRYIIPLSANILDITGQAHVKTAMYSNYNAANYVKKITVVQENTAINFDYIQTLNIDNNYLFTINFYLVSGATMPDSFTVKIKTFHLNETTQELEPVQYMSLYKDDLSSFSFNLDRIIDPYVYIETQSFNDYGLGYTNSKLMEFNEGRNFILIDSNFSNINYKYITTDYGYYIITDGRFYIIPY